LIHSDHIVISSVTTILQDIIYGFPQNEKSKKKSKVNDAETMQQLYDFIMQHLEKPLPTLKQLSAIFRVNEFELKSGFRTFFKTSIHHFYNEERLKRAHLMITQSDESLKTIAFACGFTNYNNFYKAFKKRFEYPPNSLQRNKAEE
jgi:transcriptional regulator GlxA family with amidase domain